MRPETKLIFEQSDTDTGHATLLTDFANCLATCIGPLLDQLTAQASLIAARTAACLLL